MTTANSQTSIILSKIDRVIFFLKERNKGYTQTQLMRKLLLGRHTLKNILTFLIKQNIIIRERKRKAVIYYYNKELYK